MVTRRPTKAQIESWKAVYAEYKDKLKPNRRSGAELADYLQSKYELTQFHDPEADAVVCGNVLDNPHFAQKLAGGKPAPATYKLTKDGKEVFVGIDLTSGMYHIESDERLWDELCAFQGLDGDDLKNYYCVAEYIACLKKQGRLEEVIGK